MRKMPPIVVFGLQFEAEFAAFWAIWQICSGQVGCSTGKSYVMTMDINTPVGDGFDQGDARAWPAKTIKYPTGKGKKSAVCATSAVEPVAVSASTGAGASFRWAG
jgi:hypothetical protein